MTLEAIAISAQAVEDQRRLLGIAEMKLRQDVVKFCESYRGSQRELARKLGVTPAYLHDIRWGHRTISQKMVERLMKLQ